MRFNLRLTKFLESCDSCANIFERKLFLDSLFHLVNTEKTVNSTNNTYDATTMEPVTITTPTTTEDFTIDDGINSTGWYILKTKYKTALLEI